MTDAGEWLISTAKRNPECLLERAGFEPAVWNRKADYFSKP